MAPDPGVILRGCHAPCDNQPFATNVCGPVPRDIGASRAPLGVRRRRLHDANDQNGLSREAVRTLRTTPAESRPPSEVRSQRPDLLREVRHKGCVNASLRTHFLREV